MPIGRPRRGNVNVEVTGRRIGMRELEALHGFAPQPIDGLLRSPSSPLLEGQYRLPELPDVSSEEMEMVRAGLSAAIPSSDGHLPWDSIMEILPPFTRRDICHLWTRDVQIALSVIAWRLMGGAVLQRVITSIGILNGIGMVSTEIKVTVDMLRSRALPASNNHAEVFSFLLNLHNQVQYSLGSFQNPISIPSPTRAPRLSSERPIRDIMANCEGCGETFDKDQLHFNRCYRCIEETRVDGARFFYSHARQIGDDKGPFNIIKGKRRYGVELESDVNGASHDRTQFSAVYDGSITGQELVSPILQGDPGAAAIRDVCRLPMEATPRCGFHLHLDATDLKWWDVVRLGRGYTLIQPLLFNMFPLARRKSKHCRPIKTAYFLMNDKEDFVTAIYDTNGKEGRNNRYQDKRYEFLNTHSYFYHKTIEIRLHPGTFDYAQIINWINLNQALFEHFLNPRTQLKNTTNPIELMREALRNNGDLLNFVARMIAPHNPKYSLWLLGQEVYVPASFAPEPEGAETPKRLSIEEKKKKFFTQTGFGEVDFAARPVLPDPMVRWLPTPPTPDSYQILDMSMNNNNNRHAWSALPVSSRAAMRDEVEEGQEGEDPVF